MGYWEQLSHRKQIFQILVWIPHHRIRYSDGVECLRPVAWQASPRGSPGLPQACWWFGISCKGRDEKMWFNRGKVVDLDMCRKLCASGLVAEITLMPYSQVRDYMVAINKPGWIAFKDIVYMLGRLSVVIYFTFTRFQTSRRAHQSIDISISSTHQEGYKPTGNYCLNINGYWQGSGVGGSATACSGFAMILSIWRSVI